MKTAAEVCQEAEELSWNYMWSRIESILLENRIAIVPCKYWSTPYQEFAEESLFPQITKHFDKLISLGFKVEKTSKVFECRQTKPMISFLFWLPLFVRDIGIKEETIEVYRISACCK